MERIVVGVDGSEGAGDALLWALDEARRRGATVEAVHVWHPPFVLGYESLGEIHGDWEAIAQKLLDEAVECVEFVGIPVERKLVAGRAAEALIETAKGAAMLVVGTRGRGGFTGLLLGSVSQQVAHHAPCPVVIVPPSV
ncbi:MAG TPA: universal stress protein [Acidimicrobiia bacterium]|jgi:nucleotide-binding universal stress UspA family protein|nr:universal stress protein [Acidimicrobiia bacterium]